MSKLFFLTAIIFSIGNTISQTNPPLNKSYIHIPAEDPQWSTTELFDALEPQDFDSYWETQLNALPAPDPSWDGGDINIGSFGTGWGEIEWNNASTSAKKPVLVQLPSYGSAPSVGSSPMDNRFIVCSAFNNASGSASGTNDYTVAILAIQQMIKNIQSSGKATEDVFVIGKSQGGGTGMITAGLCSSVKDVFLSVPALAGFNGMNGANGGFPGWDSTNTTGYLDAINHAKRYRNKASFSISYNDMVTWGKGQVGCAKNTQFTTTVYHGNDGHGDGDWWSNGSSWLTNCLDDIVDNGVGLADSDITINGEKVKSNNSLITCYPNPFKNELNILIEDFDKLKKIEVYSVTGKLLLQKNVIQKKNNYTINIDNWVDLSILKPGSYILSLKTNTGIRVVRICKL